MAAVSLRRCLVALRSAFVVTIVVAACVTVAGERASAAPSALYVATSSNGGADANPCTQSLPCATVQRAVNVAAAGDTINIGPGTFATNIVLATANLTFVGAGTDQTFLDGGGASTVLRAAESPSLTTVTDLTVQHGNGTGLLRSPGGIAVGNGNLSLQRIVITSNIGTGIYDEAGLVTMTDATVSSNTIGMVNFEGGTQVTNSTFTANGTGVIESSGISQYRNATIAANVGAGMVIDNTGAPSITASTIAANGTVGISLGSFDGPLVFATKIRGSIVARNLSGNCALNPGPSSGIFTDDGYNLEDDSGASCTFTSAVHDVVGTDPQLGALGSNGGMTPTMWPAVGSPAVDAIPNPTTVDGAQLCPGADQRGVVRPHGNGCDIGSVEWALESWVATPARGGNDLNGCSETSPCATVQAGLDSLEPGGTVHVGAGTFVTHATADRDVTVIGAGRNATFLDGANSGGVLSWPGAVSLTLSDVTVQHANAAAGFGALTIGGPWPTPQRSFLTRVNIQSNTGTGLRMQGGPAAISVIVAVTDSTIRDNTGAGASTDWGGIALTRSAVERNGTGLAIAYWDASVIDSTIANNVHDGIDVSGQDGEISVERSTIAGNGGYGLWVWGHWVGGLAGTILAHNTLGNCRGPDYAPFDNGYNLEDDAGASCAFAHAANDLVGVDPQLGVLSANGGTTDTMVPAWNSPVIDRIPNPTMIGGAPLCPGTDQRNVARPQGVRCDIGAIEVPTPLPPGPPRTVSATPIARSARVTFVAPLTNGGTPITAYTATCLSSNGGAVGLRTGATTPLTVAGLSPGKRYTCTVTATNAVGTGPASSVSNSFQIATAAGAPTHVVASPANASASISWTAPTSNGSSAITGYVVTPYLGGVAQPSRVFNSIATTESVSGLTNAKTYAFRVAAKNAIGIGAASVASNAIVVGSPGAPRGVTVQRVASGRLKVAFTAGANNGAPVTSYTVRCTSSAGGVTRSAVATTSPISVTSLTAGGTYRCTVSGKNARGIGPASAPSTAVVV